MVKPMPRRAGIRTGTRPVVAIIDPGLVYRERLRIPLWLSVAGVALRALALTLFGLARIGARFWPLTVVVTAGLWLSFAFGRVGFVTVAVVAACLVLAVLAWWWVLWPATFARLIEEPSRGHYRWHRVYRWRWREAMDGCGLIVRHEDTEYLPQVDAIRSNGVVDTLRLRLAAGQTPQDVSDAAEGLRHIYRALRCTVREDGPGWVVVRFFTRDTLTEPIPPVPLPDGLAAVPVVAPALALADDETSSPSASAEPAAMSGQQALEVLRRLQLGRNEDGTPWLLNLVATHVLVAGSTGA